MKVLGLDISTNTGWSILEGSNEPSLVQYGTISLSGTIKEYGVYPKNFITAASIVSTNILHLIDTTKPDIIVIEETNKTSSYGNRYSQKILEFIHCLVILGLVSRKVLPIYINSSEWRKILGIHMSKNDKKNNSIINKLNKLDKIESNIKKKKLNLRGKITKKHLSVKFVNETFNTSFKLKDNDIADSICLALSYLYGARSCTGE